MMVNRRLGERAQDQSVRWPRAMLELRSTRRLMRRKPTGKSLDQFFLLLVPTSGLSDFSCLEVGLSEGAIWTACSQERNCQ